MTSKLKFCDKRLFYKKIRIQFFSVSDSTYEEFKIFLNISEKNSLKVYYFPEFFSFRGSIKICHVKAEKNSFFKPSLIYLKFWHVTDIDVNVYRKFYFPTSLKCFKFCKILKKTLQYSNNNIYLQINSKNF